MNSFNRLSYTYRFILIEKILFDYNGKMPKFCVLKKMRIFVMYKI